MYLNEHIIYMLTDYLDRNDFQMNLLKALLKFIPHHSDMVIKNSSLDYKTYGSPRQVRLKAILQLR